ncbi:type III pantothenate kinase [Nisaea acidiphila]|uniref:Type III pantothenate kinase n=1 Tax=Nisaea acidiphila TaxID=1862145 RepID=A0A9J7ATT4_9PROT|nr:type III pantothenate kinase [Nisaea acidiphila]UUX50242.1 type III pantothenate kinase [Nisaea acidiphila]
MLLTIDCGNTNTVFAVFAGKEKRGAWRTATNVARTADEYAVWLTQLMALEGMELGDVSEVIIATVVPEVLFNLETLCRRYFKREPMVVGKKGVDLGIEIRIDHPEQVGADRLVNAVAAHAVYEGALIVIDFGTATTFDVVEPDGGYAGGIIAPGINLSLDALYRAAAQLPRIGIRPPEMPEEGTNSPVKVIGKSTVTAMHSGIFWGYIGLIEGLVTRIKEEYGTEMTVIGTGGLAAIFADCTPAIQHVDDEITLRGLLLIHERNAA